MLVLGNAKNGGASYSTNQRAGVRQDDVIIKQGAKAIFSPG